MKQRLRIVETATLPWWNASAYYAVELSRCLLERGHRVLFIGTPGSPSFCKALEYGVEVAEGIDLKRKSPWAIFTSVRKLRRLFEEFRPDVINAHQGEGHFLCTLASKKLSERPVIVRTRADIRRPKPHPFERTLYEKYTDAVITSGRFMTEKGYFDGFSLSAEKIRTIYAAIDTGRFAPGSGGSLLRSELGLGPGDHVVGITARLSPVKGHSTFIKAAAMVASRVDSARFLIAGQEKQIRREDLMRIAADAGIGAKTHFISMYPDVRQIIDCLDVGVIASLGSEAVSRAALEYMSMGKPVVSTSAGVLPEVIENGVTGFVVPPGDEKAMAEAIVRLLEEPATRARMGNASRSTVIERFSIEGMVDMTEALYRELLERRK